MALEQIDVPQFDLLGLDVNCLERIFKFLPENDLASLNGTCRRLKYETERFFSINRPIGKVWIKDTDGTIQFDFSYVAKYEVIFRSQIRHVQLNLLHSTSIMNGFEFINGNCAQSLLTLEIMNRSQSTLHINREHCDLIANRLHQLQMLSVFNTPALELMNHCENLRVLYTYISEIPEYSWMDAVCPTLELLYFDHHRDDFAIVPGLMNFLRNHRQLKSVVCRGQSAIKALCLIEHRLPYAAMLLTRSDNIANIWNDLVQCCKQKYIEWLDFFCLIYGRNRNIDKITLERILSLKHVRSLHYRVEKVNMGVDAVNNDILERLCLDFEHLYENYVPGELIQAAINFPNLRRLRILFSSVSSLEFIQNILLLIVSRFPLLEHLYVLCPINKVRKVPGDFHCDSKCTAIDLNSLNVERARLPNAVSVKIHFNECYDGKFIIPESETNLILPQFDYQLFRCPLCELIINRNDYLQKFISYIPSI